MVATLYYTPQSCGAASFISAWAAGLIQSGAVIAHEVNISNHTVVATGADFFAINPKGNVPCVVLPTGVVLNEGPACIQYIGDQAPSTGVVPAAGSDERYTFINKFNVVSELHQGHGPLFSGGDRDAGIAKLNTKFASIIKHDLGKNFLAGDVVSGADFYLMVVLSWSFFLKFDLPKEIGDYFVKISSLAVVKEAQAAMAAASTKK